jgi:hypothetical protein
MTLDETLTTLKKFGLLDRAASVKAGEVEIVLGPPASSMAPLGEVSRDDEQRAFLETQYGAAQGHIPDVS